MTRKCMILSGRVQSVGFRFTAYKAARKLGLTGRCWNLPNGSVKLELQGEPETMTRFFPLLQKINPSIRIQNIEEEEIPVVEGETGFSA